MNLNLTFYYYFFQRFNNNIYFSFFFFVYLQQVKNEIQKRLPKEWGEDEIAQLTELWERVKDDDCNFKYYLFPDIIINTKQNKQHSDLINNNLIIK